MLLTLLMTDVPDNDIKADNMADCSYMLLYYPNGDKHLLYD